MLDRTSGRMAALMGLLAGAFVGGGVGGRVIQMPAHGMGVEPSMGYGGQRRGTRDRTPGNHRPAGSKLARMASQGRIGITGGSSNRGAYANWRRTEREQARINNRAMRARGLA